DKILMNAYAKAGEEIMEQTKKQPNKSKKDAPWEALKERLSSESFEDFPLISIVIPTHNCAHTIGITLESIAAQSYEEVQVIIVDATSNDRTMEIIKTYGDLVDRIYSVTDYHIYEMINRGYFIGAFGWLDFGFRLP
ncbi:hypothetical protein SCG7109_BD_00010, partial [Chlamydiales bacterium SCGC AG-110-M15]